MPHGLRRDDCRVSRLFQVARQRSFDTNAPIRFSRPEAWRSLVFMCIPLAGGIRSRPSTPCRSARHAQRCSGPLLARRSQTPCSGPGVIPRQQDSDACVGNYHQGPKSGYRRFLVAWSAFRPTNLGARGPFPGAATFMHHGPGHAARLARRGQMRKFVIFMMVLTDLGFLVGAASARVIILKGTHTRGQVEIACTKADGVSTAGRGHGGFGCRTSKGEVECNAAGECIGKCQHCGTGEIGSIRGILRPSSGRKSPSTR